MVRFDTRHYEASHGVAPRGHGAWAFCREAYPYTQDRSLYFSPLGSLTYAQAKKLARAHFVDGTVYVLP